VACDIAGATEIYKVGGAQAIAALAYGTQSIPEVSMITGPGNAFVAAAKKQVQGHVGIDMIAGPSEVLVIADETANPAYIAIDLMAQAEHDPRAACYLVTTDATMPQRVEEELEKLLAKTPRFDETFAALSENSVALIVETIEEAVAASNVIAPEHLEIITADPESLLDLVRNAGAIFMGPWTPESVGDYSAGPNHTLPTQGTARFSSPLRVDDFQKVSSIISYDQEALSAESDDIILIADSETLWAHAEAVRMRMKDINAGKVSKASKEGI
jgi:histidinol dehydrogenase